MTSEQLSDTTTMTARPGLGFRVLGFGFRVQGLGNLGFGFWV